MPQPTLPPTPAASTEIVGKHGEPATQLEASFTLPPSAMNDTHLANGVSKPQTSEFRIPSPPSPLESPQDVAVARKKSGATEGALPPPPTRSRKIIQMKPRAQQQQQQQPKNADDDAYDPPNAKATTESSSNGRRKQNAGTSAGRKIARKTAHSLIERRRRSKMNEEFGVLKDMIPACAGQDMHKLAILQASIDYVRYLEKCIEDLQRKEEPSRSPSISQPSSFTNATSRPSVPPLASEEDSDEEMEDVVSPTDQNVQRNSSSSSLSASITNTSPAFSAYSPLDRRFSRTSNVELPSPSLAAHPQYQSYPRHYAQSPQSVSVQSSAYISPMILPQSHSGRDLDHEASAALLLLNATDRRNTLPASSHSSGDPSSRNGMRGMSVRDLLSN